MSASLALVLWLTAASPSLAPDDTLRDAWIRFIVYPSHVRVVAEYAIARTGGELRFDAVRNPGQLVVVRQATGPGFDLDAEQHLEFRRLVAPAGSAPGEMEFRFVYDVSGELGRLPVFVPDALIDAELSDLRLEIVGLPEDSALNAGDPPFVDEGGMYVSQPAALPESVEVPAPPQPRRFGLWIVVALSVLALALVLYTAFGRSGRGGEDERRARL